jgi:DNA-binding LacI/PurR family transcriptional regulator
MTRPTISDVARAAGVSKGAVSFALNDRPGVSQGTRERILKAAAELGWTPSSKARALSVSKALAVGLVIARPPETLRADPFFPTFIAGVESVLSDRGYSLLLHLVADPAREEQVYRRLAAEGRVDGVFVLDLHVDDRRPALLGEIGLPAVVIGPTADDSPLPCVAIDDAPGITAAVEHLVALGHRSIAHVSGLGVTVHGRSRARAWRSALDRAALEAGLCVEADYSAESGVRATREVLDRPDRPTAIVYANDVMATAGLSWASARGIRVPEDLSITGFDDIEMAAHLEPPLTTVTVDVLAWGEAAARHLLDVVDGTEPTRAQLPPAQLVVRGSTGPAPRT